MKSHNAVRALLGLCASLALLTPIAAHAAPALLIDKPGNYVLDKDIMVADGDAVMITATGASLDLNGHTVSVATPGKGRGIVVLNAKGVRVTNGQVGAFAVDVHLDNTENVTVEGLQIVGANLALLPAGTQNAGDPRATGGGPFAEVGVLLTNARAAVVRQNTITSVNAGIFNRGGGSTGSLFADNTITGGPIAANDFLALCFNGLPEETDPGPTASVVEGNHIGHYMLGLAWQGKGTAGNISRNNTLATWADAYFFEGDAQKNGTAIVNDTVVVTSK